MLSFKKASRREERFLKIERALSHNWGQKKCYFPSSEFFGSSILRFGQTTLFGPARNRGCSEAPGLIRQ